MFCKGGKPSKGCLGVILEKVTLHHKPRTWILHKNKTPHLSMTPATSTHMLPQQISPISCRIISGSNFLFLFPLPKKCQRDPHCHQQHSGAISLKLRGSAQLNSLALLHCPTSGISGLGMGLRDGWVVLFAMATICCWPPPSSSSPGHWAAEAPRERAAHISDALLESPAWCRAAHKHWILYAFFCVHAVGSTRNIAHVEKWEKYFTCVTGKGLEAAI